MVKKGDVGMTDKGSELRSRVFRLIKNILLLSFILFFLRSIQPELSLLINFELGGFLITGGIAVAILSLISTIYFGYFILIDLGYFLNFVDKFISTKLKQTERGKAKNIIYDIAIIISLALTSEFLAPLVVLIPKTGITIMKIINIVFLAIDFLIAYHIAVEIYFLLEKSINKMVKKTQEKLEEEAKET